MKPRNARSGIKNAAGLTAAKKNELHNQAYRKPAPLSNTKLKENVGRLLLYLQTPLNRTQQENGWQLLGVMLRQHLDLKYGRIG